MQPKSNHFRTKLRSDIRLEEKSLSISETNPIIFYPKELYSFVIRREQVDPNKHR